MNFKFKKKNTLFLCSDFDKINAHLVILLHIKFKFWREYDS